MFAASLNTLRKRTSEILKGNEGRREEAEGLDAAGASLWDVAPRLGAHEASVLGAGDCPVLVRYEVRGGTEKDPDGAIFALPAPAAAPDGGSGVTAAMIRDSFPLPGRYHFRFRVPTPDGAFGGYTWIDLPNDNELVPLMAGQVYMKAMQIPDTAAPNPTHEALPGSFLNSLRGGLGGLSFELPQLVEDRPVQARDVRGPSLLEPPEMAATVHEATAPSPASAPRPPSDLMEMEFGGGPPAAAGAGAKAAAAPAAPAPPKVQIPDRETLVAQREAREKAQYEENIRRHNENRIKEEKTKADKVQLNNKLSTEMDRWAKTSDGTSFKDIRTLLSTMHTVIWQDSGWEALSLAELVAKDGNVKRYYRKAIVLCHPDRHQEADADRQVRADRIFQALNEAFKVSSD